MNFKGEILFAPKLFIPFEIVRRYLVGIYISGQGGVSCIRIVALPCFLFELFS